MDYLVEPLLDYEIKQHAKRQSAYFDLAPGYRISIIDCLCLGRIWTQRGERRLVFEVRQDDELGPRNARTSFLDGGAICIKVKSSIYENAMLGDARARNMLARELGHATLAHQPCASANPGPKRLKAHQSARHQAGVFATAFLIHESAGSSLDARLIAALFGVDMESARIYMEERDRLSEADTWLERMAKVLRNLAASARMTTDMPFYPESLHRHPDPCPNCGLFKLLLIGNRLVCENCGNLVSTHY